MATVSSSISTITQALRTFCLDHNIMGKRNNKYTHTFLDGAFGGNLFVEQHLLDEFLTHIAGQVMQDFRTPNVMNIFMHQSLTATFKMFFDMDIQRTCDNENKYVEFTTADVQMYTETIQEVLFALFPDKRDSLRSSLSNFFDVLVTTATDHTIYEKVGRRFRKFGLHIYTPNITVNRRNARLIAGMVRAKLLYKSKKKDREIQNSFDQIVDLAVYGLNHNPCSGGLRLDLTKKCEPCGCFSSKTCKKCGGSGRRKCGDTGRQYLPTMYLNSFGNVVPLQDMGILVDPNNPRLKSIQKFLRLVNIRTPFTQAHAIRVPKNLPVCNIPTLSNDDSNVKMFIQRCMTVAQRDAEFMANQYLRVYNEDTGDQSLTPNKRDELVENNHINTMVQNLIRTSFGDKFPKNEGNHYAELVIKSISRRVKKRKSTVISSSLIVNIQAMSAGARFCIRNGGNHTKIIYFIITYHVKNACCKLIQQCFCECPTKCGRSQNLPGVPKYPEIILSTTDTKKLFAQYVPIDYRASASNIYHTHAQARINYISHTKISEAEKNPKNTQKTAITFKSKKNTAIQEPTQAKLTPPKKRPKLQ